METARRIRQMADDIGIKRVGMVINKSVDPDSDRTWVSAEFGSDSIFGLIPFDPRIGEADRKGMSLLDFQEESLLAGFRAVKARVVGV